MTGYWSLLFPGEDPVEFSDDSGIFLRDDPELQDYDIADQDVSLDGVDGTLFGVDTHGGATFALTFGVVGSSPDDARDREGTLKLLWRGDSIRATPDAVAELVSPRGRSSFGRPRRIATSDRRYFDYPASADVGAEWRAADPVWYGATRSADVGLVASRSGGITTPLRVPLRVGIASGSRSVQFVVDSEIRTWPTIRIRGPIKSPTVLVIGPGGFRWQVSFPSLNLAYDDWVDLTTVPWNRGVVRRNSGGNVPLGAASSRFDAAYLEAGTYELVLTGVSLSGSPRAFIEWRDAHSTP
ncbi:hypothetical protein [Curtobacterium sp. DN_7.5]|uniref:hypothetical protein n=1 Tax=Curtobacterium sp. DN_7.5 TaxID=3049047 RepID=UPI001F594592|nr:hypothetical protein [Curtobacterium sp. DN_7.5]